MIFFYQIGIYFFYLGILFASLFNSKAKRWIGGRKNLFQRLTPLLPSPNGEGTPARTTARLTTFGQVQSGGGEERCWVWFHCSSLGEFEQARPLIERLTPLLPSPSGEGKGERSLKILITFFSPSGYEMRKNYEKTDCVCYLPLDTKANAKKFLDLVQPSMVFFVKYDFWYNFLNETSKRKIPFFLVSANFRAEQFGGLYGMYLKKALRCFTCIFVQNTNSKELLGKNNIKDVIVSGDLRFDRVMETTSNPKKFQIIEQFKGENKLLVCGSTWEKDEQLISNIQYPISNIKLIVVPHEINESHIRSTIQQFSDSTILRFSEISSEQGYGVRISSDKEPVTSVMEKLQEANVLIIDNIGMLSSLYQYADVAYIGGGFGSGIHNILEAVAFGVPVIFGPRHKKFPEAQELIDCGGAFSISSPEEMQRAMNLLLSDERILMMAQYVCKNFMQTRKGAAERILLEIERMNINN